MKQLWLSWTDRIDISNTFTATYKRDWSGLSDNDLSDHNVVISTDDPSIADFGVLQGDQISYPFIVTEAQAQTVLDWEKDDQSQARLLAEFVGGYYLTDIERGDVIRFNIEQGDFLDGALLGSGTGLAWRDRPGATLTFRDRSDLAWRDRLGTRKYRVIEQVRRNDGAIQMKGVEVT